MSSHISSNFGAINPRDALGPGKVLCSVASEGPHSTIQHGFVDPTWSLSPDICFLILLYHKGLTSAAVADAPLQRSIFFKAGYLEYTRGQPQDWSQSQPATPTEAPFVLEILVDFSN